MRCRLCVRQSGPTRALAYYFWSDLTLLHGCYSCFRRALSVWRWAHHARYLNRVKPRTFVQLTARQLAHVPRTLHASTTTIQTHTKSLRGQFSCLNSIVGPDPNFATIAALTP